MPFVKDKLPVRLSDLVFKEVDPASRYSRESINVTPPANSAPVALGTVVFRAKSELNPYAAYAVLSNSNQLVDTNEFAVVFGDEYGFAESFVPKTVQTNTFNAVAFIRGQVQLKDYYLRKFAQDANGLNLSDANFNALKSLLKRQGIVVETTYGDIA